MKEGILRGNSLLENNFISLALNFFMFSITSGLYTFFQVFELVSHVKNKASFHVEKNVTEKSLIKILLIENNLLDAFFFFSTLTKNNFSEIVHVENLKNAIEELNESKFDLIIFDTNLPNEKATDIFTKISTNAPNIPIIAVSNFEDKETERGLFNKGLQDYLIKEKLTENELLHAVNFAIERNNFVQKINNISYFDELTSIFNRRGLLLSAEQYLKDTKKSNSGLLVLFCDLDNMKKINDTFGHLTGDKVLKDFSNILKNSLRSSDVISRNGGDEFVILIHVEQSLNMVINNISTHIIDNIRRYNIENPSIKLSVSIGATYQENINNNFSLSELIDKADKALYQNKYSKKVKNDLSLMTLSL